MESTKKMIYLLYIHICEIYYKGPYTNNYINTRLSTNYNGVISWAKVRQNLRIEFNVIIIHCNRLRFGVFQTK